MSEFTGTLDAVTPPTGCAPFATVSQEWRFWTHREDVTFRKQTGPIGTYTDYLLTALCGAVKRRALTFKEMAASAGVYTNSDRKFLIPLANLPPSGPVMPAPGDILVD